ncbi:MAG: Gfo/Idh/MocA family oxidoreductase [Proteobacteria bacterium]|nr:Gfo/Idh/MocA family oxidoreductase [Pseudomonadota bacterium]
MSKPLDILVVGAGMYVTGRGCDGYAGTIMPALLEGRRRGLVGRLAVATTRADSAMEAAATVEALAARMDVTGGCEAYPEKGESRQAFLTALDAFAPDAAIVSVPDHLHAFIAVPLAERGIHALVVKPLAGTLADARAMLAAAELAGIVAQVEFHKRLDESNLVMREVVASGELGKLLYATVEYSQRKMVPRGIYRSWAHETNIFQYLAVHYVDLLHWMTGFRPRRVAAFGQRDYLAGIGIDTWDSVQAMIEWERGDGGTFVSTHVSNWVDPDETSALSDQRINLVGTSGRYQADQKHRGIQTVQDGSGVRDLNPYFTGAWREGRDGPIRFHGYGVESVLRFVADVVDVGAGRTTLARIEAERPTFASALVSTAVIEAVRRSLESGGARIEVEA